MKKASNLHTITLGTCSRKWPRKTSKNFKKLTDLAPWRKKIYFNTTKTIREIWYNLSSQFPWVQMKTLHDTFNFSKTKYIKKPSKGTKTLIKPKIKSGSWKMKLNSLINIRKKRKIKISINSHWQSGKRERMNRVTFWQL